MLSRRDLLSSSAAVATAVALPKAPAWAAPPVDSTAKLRVLLDAFFVENLQQNPESATILGLDKGEHADLKSKLRDESAAGIAADKSLNASQQARLKVIDPTTLGGMDRVNYDTLAYVCDSRARVMAFDFGGNSYGPSPYVVSQLTGAYQQVPDFLDTKHKIETSADTDAYLARLVSFAKEVDDQTARMKHDAALGVVPPDFLLDRALEQMTATRTSADKSLLVTSIARRAKEKGLPDTYAVQATKIYDQQIGPAFDRQIAQAKELRGAATHDCGVWKLKDGKAFYAAALHFSTTTGMSPDEIHQLGLDQAKDITARIDSLLRAQGMTQGYGGATYRRALQGSEAALSEYRRRQGAGDRLLQRPARGDQTSAAERVSSHSALFVRSPACTVADGTGRCVCLQPAAGV